MGAGVSPLLTLADRVEGATGADRELDAEVAAAIRYFPAGVGFVWQSALTPNMPEKGRVECCTSLGTGGPHYKAPVYTASLDAAMGLVPEGWFWMAGNRDRLTPRAYVENGKPAFEGISSRRNPERRWYEVAAATPALALTAAALRARAAMLGETGNG